MRMGLVARFLCSSRTSPPPHPKSLYFDQKRSGGCWDYWFSSVNEQRLKVTKWRIHWLIVLQNNLRIVHNGHCGTARDSPAPLSTHSEHRVRKTAWEKQYPPPAVLKEGALSLEGASILYPACSSSKAFRTGTEELGTEPAGQQLSTFCCKPNISVPTKAKTMFPSTSGGSRLGWYLLWFLARHSPQLNLYSNPEPFWIAIKVPILETSDHLVSFICFLSFE